MRVVVRLSDYRKHEEQQPTPEELAAMFYDDALDWAGADFDRLVTVCRARDYRPEWIQHQLDSHGLTPSAHQAAILAGIVAEAGPYLSRRCRWVMRQLREQPMAEVKLAKAAAAAVEFRGYKDVPRCLQNDLARLTTLALVQIRGGRFHVTATE
jgi:predicted alpha/beta hydrolase